jgi:hypothetical protein
MTYTCLYPHRSTRGYCRCYQRCRNARIKGKKKEYSKGCMRNPIRFPFHTTPIAMILPYSSSSSSFTRNINLNYPTNPWTRTSYGLLWIVARLRRFVQTLPRWWHIFRNLTVPESFRFMVPKWWILVVTMSIAHGNEETYREMLVSTATTRIILLRPLIGFDNHLPICCIWFGWSWLGIGQIHKVDK